MKVYFRKHPPRSHDLPILVILLLSLLVAALAYALVGCGEVTRRGISEPAYPAFKFLAGPFL